MLLLEDKRYYVYIYLDPRKPGEYIYGDYKFDYEPFYVGKGRGNRYLSHVNQVKLNFDKLEKSYKNNKIKKILEDKREPIIIKIKEYITNEKACLLEIELIKLIGCLVLKTGSLTNLTAGGEGNRTYFITEETRKKLSNKRKGIKYSEETRKKISLANKGRKMPLFCIEISRRLGNSNKGKKRSEQVKKNMSIAAKKRPPVKLEVRLRISKTLKGRKLPQETIEKCRKSMLGKNHTNETKIKMKESAKKFQEKNKNKINYTLFKNDQIICCFHKQEDIYKWCVENKIYFKLFIKAFRKKINFNEYFLKRGNII